MIKNAQIVLGILLKNASIVLGILLKNAPIILGILLKNASIVLGILLKKNHNNTVVQYMSYIYGFDDFSFNVYDSGNLTL